MNDDTDRSSAGGLPTEVAYCCAAKEYLSTNNALVNTLEIFPRVIKCTHGLRLRSVYRQTVNIKNCGEFPRRLKYYTDSHDDTSLRTDTDKRYNDLQPQTSIDIDVVIRPLKRKDLNKCRHVYIEAEHPTIIFEIPIIDLAKNKKPLLPERIHMASACLYNYSYFDIPIYNPTHKPMKVLVATKNNQLSLSLSEDVIPTSDFICLLIKFWVKEAQNVCTDFKVKLGGGKYVIIPLLLVPTIGSIYISTNRLKFGELNFEREKVMEFRICNESQRTIYCGNIDKDPFLDSYCINPPRNPGLLYSVTKIGDEHFLVQPTENEIPPVSSIIYTATFHPLYYDTDMEDEDISPFAVKSLMTFKIQDEDFKESRKLMLHGYIRGPEVEVTSGEMDIKNIFIGEEKCDVIILLNVDELVPTDIAFKGYTGSNMAHVSLIPEENLVLAPCEMGHFRAKIIARIVGPFRLKLKFKVKYGNHFSVMINGDSKPIRVRPYPDSVCFGSIPIAMPQKHYVMLMNPLTVPVTMEVKATSDGTEAPLTLCLQKVLNMLPVTVKNPQKQWELMLREQLAEKTAPEQAETEEGATIISDGDGDDEGLLSERSVPANESDYSSQFEKQILNEIPRLSKEVIAGVAECKYMEKTEAERRVLTEALKPLMVLDYFKDFEYNNYKQMDWNDIPSDPQEIFVDSSIFYISPNTGKTITILLIPNRPGYFRRSLSIRVCPQDKCVPCGDKTSFYLPSADTTMRFWFDYTCCVPKIVWKNVFEFDQTVKIYAGQDYEFVMTFDNISNIEGFIYYDLAPNDENGTMFFPEDVWKFHIGAMKSVTATCGVVFKKQGNIKLVGLFKILGERRGHQFFVMAHVLPTKIRFFPKIIFVRQRVLERTRHYIYFENMTPTYTWFTLSLEHNKYQFVEPKGFCLSPNGQGVYCVLHTLFYDPDVYKNNLHVHMQYGNSFDIPITFNIEQMPIIFTPNIKRGYDMGSSLTCIPEQYHLGITDFVHKIKVCNHGERFYTVALKKFRNAQRSKPCSVAAANGRIEIEPSFMTLEPGACQFLTIKAFAEEPTTVYNEFRMTITDLSNKKRFQTIVFGVTAQFVVPELVWNRKAIHMSYYRTHPLKEHLALELVLLTNLTQMDIVANLQMYGPFEIKELFEHAFQKHLQLHFKTRETKELTVLLKKSAIEQKSCTKVDGRITVEVLQRQQRYLPLHVTIRNPDVCLCQPKTVVFVHYRQTRAEIPLLNAGCVAAQYKLKKISEETNFIGETDNAIEMAHGMLSEIFNMLDLHLYDTQCIGEDNLTHCYQKYRCELAKRQEYDPHNITGLVEELIENLDYEHKRYHLSLCDEYLIPYYDSLQMDQPSSETCVKETLKCLLDALKLEDSFEVSEASSEECESRRHIYFYEKSGTLQPQEKKMCKVHLPGLRRGYMRTAHYVLEVVGGPSLPLTVVAVHLDKTLKLSQNNIYLGIKPWYETYKVATDISNVVEQFTMLITVNTKPLRRKRPYRRLCDGYVDLLGEKLFYLEPLSTRTLKFKGIMGFSDEFMRDVSVKAKDGDTLRIRLRGQGIMPMLTVFSNLPRALQDEEEILEEYRLLQRIYYFDIFKGITEEDDDLFAGLEEEEAELKVKEPNDLQSFSNLTTRSSQSSASVQRQLFRVLQAYVMVYNNMQLPHAIILEQLLQTEKFLERMRREPHAINQTLHLVYESYQQELKRYDPKMPINVKHFTAQPLPFELHSYILKLEGLKLGRVSKYEINLHFFGPGKLIAAARTAIRIPGLVVKFEVEESDAKDFVLYNAEEKLADLHDKRYRNCYERSIDMEKDPKLKHAHSYDMQKPDIHHKREISNKDRQSINNYYNSLNKSVYPEHKHHQILGKIYTTRSENFSGTNLKLLLLFQLKARFYKKRQLIEDYLYIDLHMGPTLKILLRGTINEED